MSKKSKKLIFVCSPYGGDPKMLDYAQRCCELVMAEGNAPFAPHLHYGVFLDEKTERKLGMDCGKAWLLKSDEMWVFTKYGISQGMVEEMQFAIDNGINIVNKGNFLSGCYKNPLCKRSYDGCLDECDGNIHDDHDEVEDINNNDHNDRTRY